MSRFTNVWALGNSLPQTLYPSCHHEI